MMRLETHWLSSPGGRAINEDAVKLVDATGFTLLALADGLGGHGGGRAAARRCVDAVAAGFARIPDLSDATLRTLADQADLAVAELRAKHGEPTNSMRTTLAALAIRDGTARWLHVGDSRIYWFRGNALMRRTRDHSIAELVSAAQDMSALAAPHPEDRHQLTRALGSGEGARAELGDAIAIEVGDAFFLCSDGLWDAVSDDGIAACLADAATSTAWCVALEDRVLRQGDDRPEGRDNYSMIAAIVR
jgi:serine/threonine protein phosphatase PrpC